MEYRLDCRDLRCPMVIVRISQRMKRMAAGETLRVEAADPAFRADVVAWAKRLGHRLLEFHEGRVQQAVIEKGGK